jgi:hypothetical protein
MAKSKYGKYVISELKEPEDKKIIAPLYNKYAKRILWMDKDVVPGAFQMNTSWYLHAATTLDNKAHTHDSDEIIGFFSNEVGTNELGGEVEIWLEDEMQLITKSAMLFIPAGMVHCPLILRKVTRPIFHFTVVTSGLYIRDEKE